MGPGDDMRAVVVVSLLAACGYRYQEPVDPYATLSCPTAPASGPGVDVCADGPVESRYQASDGVAVRVIVVTGTGDATSAPVPLDKDGASDESRGDTGSGPPPPTTAVRVEFDTPTAVVLLSPDRERSWIVDEVHPGTVTAVMIDRNGGYGRTPSGVHRLYVEPRDDGPYDVPDEDDTAAPVPSTWGAAGTFAVLAAVRRELQAGVASFHVCDGCAALALRPSETPNDVVAGPDCTTPEAPLPAPETAPFADACPSVAGQGTVCLTGGDGAWTLVGLDDGATCALPAVDPGSSVVLDSIAWSGTVAFACRDRRLVRQDLLTGVVETSEAPCGGVAPWKGGLLLSAPGGHGAMSWVASFRDARCGRAVEVDADLIDATFTVRRSTMYSAWHSGGLVRRTTLPSGTRGQSVELQGYDGWMYGIASPEDDVLLVLGEGPAIRTYDLISGAQVGEAVPASGAGLACVRRETDPATPAGAR